MVTVSGKLQTIENAAEAGSIEVALCGYGSQVPRLQGGGLGASVTDSTIPIGSDGTFSFKVVSNDAIDPAATYYTVTVKDDNGDIVQVNAYRFTPDGEIFDLNTLPPYDPNQPPPPVPPLIVNMLQLLAAAADMVFDGTTYTAFQTTLVGDVDYPVFQNMVPGNLYTFIIIQDSPGNWNFVWAGNVENATPINRRAGSTTVQTFVADELGNLLAISAGTYQ